MLVLSTKPLQNLTGTDRQAGRQDHVLSQADALTKEGGRRVRRWDLFGINQKWMEQALIYFSVQIQAQRDIS